MKTLVEKYQCPGCVLGKNTECGNYKPAPYDDGSCVSHTLGTTILGLGRIALGLPKGFNREGPGKLHLRIFKPQNTRFDNFNVAVWAMTHDENVIVRTYTPRLNTTYVDILANTDKLPEGSINVAEFYNEID